MSDNREYKGKNLKEFPENYTIVDLETTGFSPDCDEIIEIGAVRVRNGKPVEEYQKLIKPCFAISNTITKITGITNAMVCSAPNINSILPEALDFIGDDIIVGHNVNFDINFLYDNSIFILKKPVRNNYVDTLLLSRRAYPKVSHKLEDLVSSLNLEDGQHHRALADCYHTYNLLNKIKSDNPEIINEHKPTHNYFQTNLTEATKSIQQLNKIIEGIVCDKILTPEETIYLNEWLENNTQLSGNYPYDYICNAVAQVLEDGIIEECELRYLLKILNAVLNPVESENNNDMICFCGKNVVLSGDFKYGSKKDVTEYVTSQGGEIKSGVTKLVDILLVGDNGSDAWACGNYGTKVKKALEMQAKGHQIKIVKECEVFKV